MLDKTTLARQWPLILATVLLSATFAWAFLLSIQSTQVNQTSEGSLNTDPSVTQTSELRSAQSDALSRRSTKPPSPWWPALMFSLAFLCGWIFRNALRPPVIEIAPEEPVESYEALPTDVYSEHYEQVFTPGQSLDQLTTDSVQSAPQEIRSEPESEFDSASEIDGATGSGKNIDTDTAVESYSKPASETDLDTSADSPDLAVDFPWDENAIEDLSNLSDEERIAYLEKQNASKAEIIQALEKLVAENREKWLHRDETEARLDQHIRDLSEDLRVAVRQLQHLHADQPAEQKNSQKNTG